jgi:hypothetical protein
MSNIDQATIVPVEGTHATIHYPQDSYPAVVVRATKSGKTAWIKTVVAASSIDSIEPSRYDGPWPVYDHTYTDEEVAEYTLHGAQETRVFLRKDGHYRTASGALVTFGSAHYYRNFSY